MSGTPAGERFQSPAGGTPQGVADRQSLRDQVDSEIGHVQPALNNVMNAKNHVVKAAAAWRRSRIRGLAEDLAARDLLTALDGHDQARAALRRAVEQLQRVGATRTS